MGRAKLNKRKINYIIRAKRKGQSYKQIARDLKISVSTVKKSYERSSIEPLVIPNFLYKIWKERFREYYNMDIENDLLDVIIRTYYIRSTWKWQRAYKEIKKILSTKGMNERDSRNMAKMLISLFDS